MTGRATEAGRAEAVGAAPHRRLVGQFLIALPRAIAPGMAIPTPRMLEDLAGLDEEGNRALGPVDDGGEGLGPAQRGGVLSAGCARAPPPASAVTAMAAATMAAYPPRERAVMMASRRRRRAGKTAGDGSGGR